MTILLLCYEMCDKAYILVANLIGHGGEIINVLVKY